MPPHGKPNKIKLLDDSDVLISPATKGKQDEMITAISGISGGMAIPAHDYIEYGYTGSDITTITYKSGGSGGTTVATVTITYNSGNPLTKTLTLP